MDTPTAPTPLWTPAPRRTIARCGAPLAAAVVLAGCSAMPDARVAVASPTTPGAVAPPVAQRPPPGAVARADLIDPGFVNPPYSGALPPGDPPLDPFPKNQKPVPAPIVAALDALYEAPTPPGPPAIPLPEPKALYVVGKDPVIQVLPGPPAFPDKIPHALQVPYPPKVPFSNNVKKTKGGTFRMVSYDRTANDTLLSEDSMEAEISFSDAKGDRWTIEQVRLAPLSPQPVSEPWWGGLAIDVPYHGHTGQGTPAVPRVRCMHCSWGWADVYKNGKRVASSAPLHIMVTSDSRDNSKNFEYYSYDVYDRPVKEVHIIVAPAAGLPSPGGFLHIMWENLEMKTGTPEQIAAIAPKLGEDLPTIAISAVPYLQWSSNEIHVKAGQKYRLLVHNMDPTSFHQFHLHSHPSHHGHGHGSARHEETMTAGRIGPLWKPDPKGQPGHSTGGHGTQETDPPAPRHVFFPIPEGSTWATMVTFEKPGEYEFGCPVGNHYRRGMEGKFIVSADGPVEPRYAKPAKSVAGTSQETRR